MMLRTHILFALAVGLALFPFVAHRFSFLPLIVVATMLPDIDMAHSYLGKWRVFRPLQWFVKHRGLLHSLAFCLGITAVLAFFMPVIALPFFLGYALHLFADSMTIEGIRPLWPARWEARGFIRTGSTVEAVIFYVLCGACVVLAVMLAV